MLISSAVRRVLWQIIPGLQELSRTASLFFDGRVFGQDLHADDRYWAQEIIFKCGQSSISFEFTDTRCSSFALPPRCAEWDPSALSTLTQTVLLQGPTAIRRPLSPVWQVANVPVRIIKTQFDLHNPAHDRPTFVDGDDKTTWTQNERDKIVKEREEGKAIICRTFEELEAAVRLFLWRTAQMLIAV